MSPHLERVRARAEAVTRGFVAEDWQQARPGKWSAAAILEHLILSYTGTTRGLLKTLKAAEPFCPEMTAHFWVAQFYVLRMGIFPRGVQAPKSILPTGAVFPDPLRKFNDALVAMDASLADAERRFGKRTRVLEHPVLGPLTAEQWRRFHRVHAFHHLAQIAALGRMARSSAVSV